MNIKHRSSFKLFAYGKDKDKFQIRLRVTFGGQRQDYSTGCQVYDIKAWDAENELVLSWYEGPRGENAININNKLRNIKDQMETSFKYFEALDIIPTIKQLSEKYEQRINGTISQRPAAEKNNSKPKERDFFEVYDEFMRDCGEKNAWTEATCEKMMAMREDLMTFKKKIKFSDLTEKTLTEFVIYLRDKKVLKTPRKSKDKRDSDSTEDLIGLKNSTINKKLGYLRWFLNWATNKGFNKLMDFKTFRPTLKSTQKKVIYLTTEELKRVRDFDLSAPKLVHLEAVRDIFMFCCFSSLRYSDASSLRWNDVKDDHIEVTTVKTNDSLTIEINDIMRSILDKYKEIPVKGNLVFPYYTNQAMNRSLKELCNVVGINSQERVTTYKGNERIDEIKEKWELIGTHTGRRTFIVNALSRGIAPSVVMKWTGHSSYASMKPYIDIVDTIKANEMNKMNFLND